MIEDIEELGNTITAYRNWWANQTFKFSDEIIQRALTENFGTLQSWAITPQLATEVAKMIEHEPISFRSCTLHLDLRLGLAKRYTRYGDNWTWVNHVIMFIHSKSYDNGRIISSARRQGVMNKLWPYLPKSSGVKIVRTVERKKLKGWYAATSVVEDVLDRMSRDSSCEFAEHLFRFAHLGEEFREKLPYTARNCLREFLAVYFNEVIGEKNIPIVKQSS